MQTLLEKTREINKLLQRSGKIGCAELVKVLRDVIVSNIYIVSNEGHVRGYALINDFECDIMKSQVLDKSFFPKNYTKWLADCHNTLPNVELQDRMCAFKSDTKCLFDAKMVVKREMSLPFRLKLFDYFLFYLFLNFIFLASASFFLYFGNNSSFFSFAKILQIALFKEIINIT